MKALLAAVKNLLFPARDRGARRCRGLTHICVGLTLFGAWTTPPSPPEPGAARREPARPRRVSESELDAALLRAASLALGSREGSIIVADAQTGRVRAAVNPRTAEQAAFPPGSAIKPFTLLAALRARAIDADARLSCRKHYTRHGADFTCSHPVYVPPFSPAQALAHSCNYYFARLAEHLPTQELTDTLAAYGFGASTAQAAQAARPPATPQTTLPLTTAQTVTIRRATAPRDRTAAAKRATTTARMEATTKRATTATAKTATPRLPRGNWQVKTALGEGDELLVTPLQLLAAYAALFNGGHLYRAQAAAPEDFRAERLARLDIAPGERALLLSGLRGAVRYGTAAPADLASLPTHVFGKTGTATDASDGFHTHGWFVGLASEREARADDSAAASRADESHAASRADESRASSRSDESHAASRADAPAPGEVKLAVLVFLKRGQGKESAAVARAVFAEHARLTAGDAPAFPSRAAEASASGAAGDFLSAAPRRANGATLVRVRLAREESVLALPLDEYLFGVLAAESSVEDEFAALKAQAVVSRTYTLSNLRRHARDGYDLCDTTHCQRFLQVTRENARPDFHDFVRRAVGDTSGEVLRDARGSLASDVFFSTSCGGQTANLHTLWGARASEPYLRGVRDEYCAAMPHARWTDAIPAARLAKALREDSRTDVGARVEGLSIVKRDATGRVEQLSITGERRRVVVRGWDFKIIVGRALGWSVLKSSRFEVMRAGDKFVFRGSGFGHGLGLCQSGAHVMAARGAAYRQILAHYFPGTTVGGERPSSQRAETKTAPTPPPSHAHARRARPRLLEKAAIEHEKTAIQHEKGAPEHESAALEDETAALEDEKAALEDETAAPEYVPGRLASSARARSVEASDVEASNVEVSDVEVSDVEVSGLGASGVRVRVGRASGGQARGGHVGSVHGSGVRAGFARERVVQASFAHARLAASPAQARLSLSSENFRVSYPARAASASRRDVEGALAALEAARADMRSRLAAAGVAYPALGIVEVFVHETTGGFTGATGKPAWVAATTRGARRIELQPLSTLGRRGLLAPTLRHEYAHAVINALSRSRAPLWLSEGLAAHVAGEGRALVRHASGERRALEDLEHRLAAPADAAEMRALYADAFRAVAALIRAEGEASVWRRVARS